MKLINNLVVVSMLGAALPAAADVIGGSVEVGYWQGKYSGKVVSKGEIVDVKNELNFDDTAGLEISVALEHPVPVLPNVRLRHVDLDETENGTINGITFNGINFTADADVRTQLDLTHMDLVLYYEVLDNYVSLDLGLDIKRFDGELDILEVDNPSNRSTTEIDETIPLLYAAAEVELPLTGLALGAELSAISYDGDSLHDARVRLRQNLSIAFIELGYRQFVIDVEDVGSVDVDADIKGVYISTGLDF